ncbi:MAG: class I SAM-dependent methyltransferase [Rubrobacter sp.]|nr:class I SAM-dependent methyltransferase [Rubrobacter sp.]
MFASNISPLRWVRRIVLVIMAVFGLLFMLQQVVVRIVRRAAPRPMPARLAPVLTMPWRSRLFGSPEQILNRAGVAPGMRVLEIGPGPGVYTVPLARRVASQGTGGNVTCLEIQPEMIAMLQERLEDAGVQNVEVIQGDGRYMPLADGSFDLVFLTGVLGETPDLAALFSECARVLKPGGILAVTEQVSDPDFRLPSTVQTLAVNAGFGEDGRVGLSWWAFTARYRK